MPVSAVSNERETMQRPPDGLKAADVETVKYRKAIKGLGYGVVFRSGVNRATTLKILESDAAGKSKRLA